MKNAMWVIVAIIIIAGGYWWWSTSASGRMGSENTAINEGAASEVPGVTVPSGTGTSTSGADGDTSAGSGTDAITMATVATHSTKESCWSVIDNNVYDLTSWIGKHPGGERAIISLCGKDGTTKFHGQHGDNKLQANILAGFKLGVLAQ